jgi:uncharacterized protein (TIGR00251 family)
VLLFQIKVVPQSGRQEVVLDRSGRLKCYLKSAPEKGKANKELIAFLAERLSIGKNEIEIRAGLTVPSKQLAIAWDWSLDDFYQKLGLSKMIKEGGQYAIF